MDKFYSELYKAVDEIKPYYDVDKVKSYSVYIWTKVSEEDYQSDDNFYGENVFDIMKDKIIFYNKDHVIPEEVKPIICKIQSKLMN